MRVLWQLTMDVSCEAMKHKSCLIKVSQAFCCVIEMHCWCAPENMIVGIPVEYIVRIPVQLILLIPVELILVIPVEVDSSNSCFCSSCLKKTNVCVCVCVRACVRACVCTCVCASYA